jgi:Amt family ammonium transporter
MPHGVTQNDTVCPDHLGDNFNPGCERLHVLVADDNEVNQMVAAEMLRAAGYDSTVVSNGLEAVTAIRKGNFDIVLMDCEMPELDGFAATRMVRMMEAEQSFAMPISRPLPIIALTAQAVQGDRERCLDAGMTDYVTKPVNRAELLKTIRACIAEIADQPSHEAGETLSETALASPMAHGGSEFSAEDGSVLDFDELNERCMGDRDFMDELLRIFVRKARSNVTRISSAIKVGRIDDVARVAHELKGSAGNVAACRLSQVVTELETAARERTDLNYHELGERVHRELDFCEQAIQSLLDETGV